MEELLKLYTNRVKRLKGLLREYEEYMETWDGINLIVRERRDEENPNKLIPTVEIEFYKYVVKLGYDRQPMAYKHSTSRTFDFSIDELDKAIDRYRKKIAYEKEKVNEGQG